MELNIKFNEKMLVEIANGVLDEYKYNGKTIREWADLIANPKTNANRIHAMTDEELAEFFMREYDGEDSFTCPVPHPCPTSREASCKQCFLDWLRQEAKDA